MKRILQGNLAFLLLASVGAFATTVGPAKGTLVIVGGGKLGPEITSRFVTLAGGAQATFVVIPTAGEDKDLGDLEKEKQEFAKTFGVDPALVTVLHARDRKLADSPQFAAPLK